MKSRVLITTFTYPPNKDGVASACGLLAEGLATRGHQVLIATLRNPHSVSSTQGSNPSLHEFEIGGTPSVRDGLHGQVGELKKFVADFDGDVIISHCLDTALTSAAMQGFHASAANKVLVSHGYPVHMVPWQPRFPWGLARWLGWQPFVWRLPSLLRKFNRVVFLSSHQDWGRFFDHRIARLIGHPGIRVIPNGVDWKTSGADISGFLKQHGILGKLLFLCVANYCDRKNQLLALRAYRRARIANSALVFIGSEFNDYSRQMNDLDRALRPEFPEGTVIVLEKIGRDITEALLQSMDVFVLSAKQETQPIVLLESMAAAKPFVSTDTGCVRELAGGLVATTEKELVEKLRVLADNAKLRERLGMEGRSDFLAHYRKEAVLDAYEKLINELRSQRA